MKFQETLICGCYCITTGTNLSFFGSCITPFQPNISTYSKLPNIKLQTSYHIIVTVSFFASHGAVDPCKTPDSHAPVPDDAKVILMLMKNYSIKVAKSNFINTNDKITNLPNPPILITQLL